LSRDRDRLAGRRAGCGYWINKKKGAEAAMNIDTGGDICPAW
jgi:hypothetical protein